MGITSINPSTGKRIKTYDEMTPGEAEAAVSEAHNTWQVWWGTAFAERGGLMKKAADILRERRHELAHLMASEMGKPLEQRGAETEKCAWACDY